MVRNINGRFAVVSRLAKPTPSVLAAPPPRALPAVRTWACKAPALTGLAAPRRMSVRAAACPSGDCTPVGPTPEVMHLAMAWGGKRFVDAATLAPSTELDAATARMQAHHDPIARRDFVLGLLRRPGVDALPMLERFASDDDVLVRWAVAQPGAVWQTPQSAAILERLSVDPNAAVRQTLAHTLGATATATSAHLLCRMADDADVWVRLSLVPILGQRCAGREIRKALDARLDDPDAWVRASALQTLAQMAPDAATLDGLARVARTDTQAWVRHVALRELALVHPWRARLVLARMPKPQGSLVCMLLRFAPELPIRLLSDALRFCETDMPHRPWPFEHMVDIVRDSRSSGNARFAAQQQLIAQAREVLAQATNTPKPNGRGTGSGGTGPGKSTGLREGVSEAQAAAVLLDPLHPILALDSLPGSAEPSHVSFAVIDMARRSLDPMARSHVAWLLSELSQHPNAWPLLATMLDDPQALVRQQMANGVLTLAIQKRLPIARLLPLVQRLLTDDHPDVRKVAVAALGNMPCDVTDTLLGLAAQDPEPLVRVASMRALSETNPHSRTLVNLAADGDIGVRSALASALPHMPFTVMYLAPRLLNQSLTPASWQHLTGALAGHARGAEQFAREVSLNIIDGMRSAEPVLAEAEHDLRARLWIDVLRAEPWDMRPPSILLRWASELHLAGTTQRADIASRFATLRHHRGHPAVFAVLLNSPADDVREAARQTMGQIFNEIAEE